MKCKEGCFKCCGPVLVTEREVERLGLPKGSHSTGARADGACALLGEDGRCTKYDDRPYICKMFGETSVRESIFFCPLTEGPHKYTEENHDGMCVRMLGYTAQLMASGVSLEDMDEVREACAKWEAKTGLDKIR